MSWSASIVDVYSFRLPTTFSISSLQPNPTLLWFKEDHKPSDEALKVLEEIDDDLDEHGIMFVKLDDEVNLSNT